MMDVPARSRAALPLAWAVVNYSCAGLRRGRETQQSILRKETCVRRTQNEPGYSTASDTPPVQNSRVVESVSAEGGTHTLASIFLGARREERKIRFPEHPHCPGCFLRPHTLSKPARRRNRFLTTERTHTQNHCILCICCRCGRDRCATDMPNDPTAKRLTTEVGSMNHSRPSSRQRVG